MLNHILVEKDLNHQFEVNWTYAEQLEQLEESPEDIIQKEAPGPQSQGDSQIYEVAPVVPLLQQKLSVSATAEGIQSKHLLN